MAARGQFYGGLILGADDVVVAQMVSAANARLIAAAPELLEACKALDHWLYEVGSARANGESVYSYTELQSMRDNAAELVRAAIAKATGESA